MVNHRKPPKPASWNCPRGECRFCGSEIIENGTVNRRKHWHQACADIWKIMNDPQRAREHVTKRDSRTCHACGDRSGPFDVDHRLPLFEAAGDPSYWHPDNLFLLCKPCHVEKTRDDMKRYRAGLTDG